MNRWVLECIDPETKAIVASRDYYNASAMVEGAIKAFEYYTYKKDLYLIFRLKDALSEHKLLEFDNTTELLDKKENPLP